MTNLAAELRRLNAARTPGPWKYYHGGIEGDDGFSIGSDNVAAELVKSVVECWPCSIVNNAHRDELKANGDFILCLTNNAAAIIEQLERVERLEAENAKLRRVAEAWRIAARRIYYACQDGNAKGRPMDMFTKKDWSAVIEAIGAADEADAALAELEGR